MNVHEIIADWLRSNGYDGLYCEDVLCGCLNDDLAPCETHCDFEGCKPGYRVDHGPASECGCEGEGTAHWHVQKEKGGE